MKKLWTRYAERIDALSLRERVLVFSAAMALLLAILYSVLIDSEMRTQRRLSSTIAQRQAELKSIEVQLTAVATSRAADPDRPMRERLANVRAQLADIERQISAEERKFTAPREMKAVIEEMLARNRAVELVAMRTLPTGTIAEAREGANAAKP